MAKAQFPSARITTGTGSAHYPHVHAPDTRFAKDPNDAYYKCGIVLKGKEAKAVLATAKKLIDEARSKGLTSAPAKLPGEWDKETETLTLKNAKSRYAPALFDAQGNKMPEGTRLGGGSQIRMALNLAVYEGFGHTGVTAYLNAVQVISLVETGGGSDATSFGFDATEGFTFDEAEADPFTSEPVSEYDDSDFDSDGDF